MSDNPNVIEDSAFDNNAPKKRARATKSVAEKTVVENVDISSGSNSEENKNVIKMSDKPKAPRKSNNFNTKSNVIGSKAADIALSKKLADTSKPENDKNKVALWSDKNIRWSGVGSLNKGYNIVDKEFAQKWLTRGGIRESSPEEVATYYGKD